MNPSESQPAPGSSQPPPERQSTLRNFFIRALSDVYAKLFAIITFIYVTLSFLKILGTLPEPLDTLIIVVIVLYFISYILYKIYKWTESRDRRLWELIHIIENLTKENKKLTDEIKNLTIQFIKPKDPAYLIDDHLGYPDVKFAVYCLSKKIEGFFVKDGSGKNDARRNIIIGIDRGGAIVGGLLAKNLGVAIKTLAINYANESPEIIPAEEQDPSNIKVTSIIAGKCLENIDFESVTNILLVDDAIRGGNTMLAAKHLLRTILSEKKKSFHFVCDDKRHTQADEIKINIACILYRQKDVRPPIKLPEFCVYQTIIDGRWLLWDTTHEEVIIKGEEKKLFDEYYKHIPNGLLK